MNVEKEDPRALAAFEDLIRRHQVRGLLPDHFLAKLEAHESTNPEFSDRLIDAEWQIFLAGWKAAVAAKKDGESCKEFRPTTSAHV